MFKVFRPGGLRLQLMRMLQLVVLGAVTVAMLGAAGESRFDRLGHAMMCTCSCGQILLECNHVGCPDSARMINELKAQLASGASDTAIFNWFVSKYGAVVLAAPTRGGFDNVAWIMPISVFLFATLGTGVVVWLWRRRSLRLAGATHGFGTLPVPHSFAETPQDDALRERIRRETEY